MFSLSEQPSPADLGITIGQVFYHFNPRPRGAECRPIPKGQPNPFTPISFYGILDLTPSAAILAPIGYNSYEALSRFNSTITWFVPFKPTPQDLILFNQDPSCHRLASIKPDPKTNSWALTVERRSLTHLLTPWDGTMVLSRY